MNFRAEFFPRYAFLIALPLSAIPRALLLNHSGNEREEGRPFPSQRGRECLRVSIRVLARQTCTRIAVDFIYEVSQRRIFQECMRLDVDLVKNLGEIDDN